MKSGIGKELKAMREKVNLSQADVAKYLKYDTPQFISNWEREVSMVPYSAIPKVARIYGVSPVSLFQKIFEHNKQQDLVKALKAAKLSL